MLTEAFSERRETAVGPGTRARANLIIAGKVGADTLVFCLAYVLAFLVRFGMPGPHHVEWMLQTLPLVVAAKLATFALSGSYRCIWRYTGNRDLCGLSRAALAGALSLAVLGFLLPTSVAIPRAIPIIDLVWTILLAGALRVSVRLLYGRLRGAGGAAAWRHALAPPGATGRPTLVVGAGDTGEMMVREISRNETMKLRPVAFVDDDPAMTGMRVRDIPVLGTSRDIPELVRRLGIREVLVAMPSAKRKVLAPIVSACHRTGLGVRIVPDLDRASRGSGGLSALGQVRVDDLLGREPAELDASLIAGHIRGKTILVTGAGGSIGSELCRQILPLSPAEVVLFGRGEFRILEAERDLVHRSNGTRLVPVIGDVINRPKLEKVLRRYRPDVIYHAGADKHVPLMELNPDEAVLNNIVGTRNVLEAANATGVGRVVCVSTDKAVNPGNVMGCCKRVAELLVQSGLYPNTVPVAVRFGNVLGSRGSVIPLFRKQIESGGPITVTHREIRRYFMTVREAAGLVIQAGTMGKAGDIFVLDMGDPVRIWDLAKTLARLAGLEPGRDIEVVETGLRPGEKLDEELFGPRELPVATAHPKIHCARSGPVNGTRLLERIDRLKDMALVMDLASIRRSLLSLVPEYQQDPDFTPPPLVGRFPR